MRFAASRTAARIEMAYEVCLVVFGYRKSVLIVPRAQLAFCWGIE
jgi:hypothetical protein